MALPDGIQTVLVTMGSAMDFAGEVIAGATVVFTPSTSVIWAATGTPIFARPLKVVLDENGAGSIMLPATDQAGFVDGQGNAITDWTYQARWSGPSGVPVPAPASFQLPYAAEAVDLDLMIPVEGSTGVTVELPAILSIQPGTGIAVDNTNPASPKISATGGGTGGGAGTVTSVNDVVPDETGNVALGASDVGAATTDQGAKADTAVQPGSLSAVATSGLYSDLIAKPTIPTSASEVGAVPTGRKVAGKTLDIDVVLAVADILGLQAAIDTAPAIISESGGAYPLRSSATSNAARTVIWRGPDAPAVGSGYAVDGVDIWWVTP